MSRRSRVKRRFPLRGNERKTLLKRFSEAFNIDAKQMFGVKPKVEVIETDRNKIFVVNGEPLLASVNGEDLIPTLIFEDIIQRLPKVIVDMGAVPHVCNGADIMAPGVVRIDGDFKRGDFALVIDEKHGKAIAVVRAILDSESTKALKHGKVFKNLHYVGDIIWRVIRGENLRRKS